MTNSQTKKVLDACEYGQAVAAAAGGQTPGELMLLVRKLHAAEQAALDCLAQVYKQ